MKTTSHAGNENIAGAVEVCETFLSIQGESSYAGLTCFFIRLSGCNLACEYCDTLAAREPGRSVEISDLVPECVASNASISEITGGEPLLQPGFATLARELHTGTNKPVLVETNGSCDISVVPSGVVVIMDIKTPGSGVSDQMDLANIGRLRSHDEVKFVLTDRRDYDWACEIVTRHNLADLCHAVLFSAAFGRLEVAKLAKWMVEDRATARLQVQLQRIIGAK